jgi:hypothetical protein
MAFISKKSAVIYVTQEVTEGTAVNPTLGVQAVGVLADGFELNGEKELVERNVLRTGIGKQVPLTGIKSATVSLGVEASASKVEGDAPEFDLLIKGALGGKRQVTTEVTSTTGHSVDKVYLSAGDLSKFNVGDIVLVKETAHSHISPVKAVGVDHIELLVASDLAFTDGVVISKSTNYFCSNTGHPSLTVTSFLEDAIKMQASGCKVASMAIEGFEVGQLPSFNFSLQGGDYVESVQASGLSATFSSATPPIILGACVFMDGQKIHVNSASVSVDNTVGKITSTCLPNGVISQLITERAVSGSFVTYLDSTNVNYYEKFNKNQNFSLFFYMANPNAIAGEMKNAIGVYIPSAIITSQPKADQDGVMTIQVDFQVGSDDGKDIVIGFM